MPEEAETRTLADCGREHDGDRREITKAISSQVMVSKLWYYEMAALGLVNLKQVNFMVCELYLNCIVVKTNYSQCKGNHKNRQGNCNKTKKQWRLLRWLS